MASSIWERTVETSGRVIAWTYRNVPRGLRSGLGVILILGGVVGFLPVLGFWMVPAGLALVALDIPPLRRRVLAWLKKRGAWPSDDADNQGEGKRRRGGG